MPIEMHMFDNSKHHEDFSAGAVIFEQGSEGDMMYVIIEGEVDIEVDGKHFGEVGAGGIVGEMSLIEPGPRSATVKARTDVKLYPVNQRQFNFLVQQTPTFPLDVMKILVERLRKATEVGANYLK